MFVFKDIAKEFEILKYFSNTLKYIKWDVTSHLQMVFFKKLY